MEKCKFCQADLEENNTVCPACGKENAAPEEMVQPETESRDAGEVNAEAVQEPAVQTDASGKKSPMTIALAVIAAVLLLAVIIGAVYVGSAKQPENPAQEEPLPEELMETVIPTVPEDGNPDDVTCKGTYTASAEELADKRDTVIARAGDLELTLGQFQIYYWMAVYNDSYAPYFGLDYSQSFDTQPCGVSDQFNSWQQYFINSALSSWLDFAALSDEAQKQDFALAEEYRLLVEGTAEDMDNAARESGYEGGEAFLQLNFGPGAKMEDYVEFRRLNFHGYSYFENLLAEYEPTDEELDAFYELHAEGYAEGGLTKDVVTVDVRHILIYPEGADGTNINTEEFPEEAWAAGEEQAQAILEEWLAGEQTEESFAALANAHSQDPGSNTNGGLYTDVTEGEMVPAFNDWCFDAERRVGDYGIVRTNYGYHVMFFSGSRPMWVEYARSDYMNEKADELVKGITGNYSLDVDYSAILIGEVDLNA